MPTKSQIMPEDVRRIATLARLGLTDTEVQKATKDLSGILSHFSVIQKIDTKDVPAADDASGLKNVSRVDEAHENVLCEADELIALAPDKLGREIKVPAVFE